MSKGLNISNRIKLTFYDSTWTAGVDHDDNDGNKEKDLNAENAEYDKEENKYDTMNPNKIVANGKIYQKEVDNGKDTQPPTNHLGEIREYSTVDKERRPTVQDNHEIKRQDHKIQNSVTKN
jgi:hypothetical protein